MGHYASEMAGPVRHDPEVHLRRRHEARRHATFVWDLYRKYEEQGEYIREEQKLTCPRCFATVPAVLRVDHQEWHNTEAARLGLAPLG